MHGGGAFKDLFKHLVVAKPLLLNLDLPNTVTISAGINFFCKALSLCIELLE